VELQRLGHERAAGPAAADEHGVGLASSPFTATCTDSAGVNHNIINRPNLFTR